MAYSIFSYTSQAKVDLLNKRMQQRQYYGSKLGQLVAPMFVKAMGGKYEVINLTNSDVKFSEAPVEVFHDFVKEGQVDMRIPIAQNLNEMPVHGDNALEGNEERQSIAWRSVKINRTRHGVRPITGMSRQLTKPLANSAAMKAETQLREWLNRYHPGGTLMSAILAGYSRDLLMPTRSGGRAQTAISHPNFIVAGHGFVEYTSGRPGVSGYEGLVESYVDGLNDASTEGMSLQLIRNMVLEAPTRKVLPMVTKEGFQFYPIFVSLSQWAQLLADPEAKDWLKRINETSLAKHPVGNLANAYFEGAAIIPDLGMWGIRTNQNDSTVTAGTVEYGPARAAKETASGAPYGNWMKKVQDGNDRKVAVLVGRSMLSIGIGEEFAMMDDDKDYGNIKGVAIDGIHSAVRNDVFDQDGGLTDEFGNTLTAGQFQENTGSIVAATYSPETLAY